MKKIFLDQILQAISLTVMACLMCKGPTSFSQTAAYLQNCFLAERIMTRPKAAGQDGAQGKSKTKAPPEQNPKNQ